MLRRQGAQPPFDVSLVADELARLRTCGEASRLLFDWSLADGWRFEAPSTKMIEAWRGKAPKVARVAIVYAPKLRNQAALMSALLRMRDTEVLCFRPVDYEKAVEWLERGSC